MGNLTESKEIQSEVTPNPYICYGWRRIGGQWKCSFCTNQRFNEGRTYII